MSTEYRELVDLVEGELGRSREDDLLEHLQDCGACWRAVEQLRSTISIIGEVDEEVAATDLVPTVMRRVTDLGRSLDDWAEADAELGEVDLVGPVRDRISRRARPKPARRRRLFFGVTGSLAAAAVLLLVQPATEDASEFRVKSGLGVDSKTGVTAYRVVADKPTFLAEQMVANDALSFAYSNAGKETYEYLMVLGIDAQEDVHWYYPAYTDPTTDPEAIPITAGGQQMALPDQVRHQVASGDFVILALFGHQPVRVSEIESAVTRLTRAGRWDFEHPPQLVDDTLQQTIRVEVK